MSPNVQRLDLTEDVSPETVVAYETLDLNGYTDPHVRAFHDKLMEIGRIPHGLLMRFGTDPLQTFASAGEQLRERMRLAFQDPPNIHARFGQD